MKLNELKTSPLMGVCDECLRGFAKQLLKNVGAEEDIKRVVMGLENLGEKNWWA
jgi:hypothetical protein